MPVEIIEYNDTADMFTKEEPTLRKLEISKTGEVEINFSSEMVYPENWV